MRTVIIESPYSSPDPLIVARNVRYAKMCMKDSLDRGEAPFLSHLLYTWVYDDQIPALREAGIQAGLEIGKRMDATIVYTDLGISPGMEKVSRTQSVVGDRSSIGNWAVEMIEVVFWAGALIYGIWMVIDDFGDRWRRPH